MQHDAKNFAFLLPSTQIRLLKKFTKTIFYNISGGRVELDILYTRGVASLTNLSCYANFKSLFLSRRGAPCEGTNSAGRGITLGYCERTYSGIQSRPNSISSTLDGLVSNAHAQNLNEWRLVISDLLIGRDKEFLIQ